MTRVLIFLVAVLVALLFSVATLAQVYKSVDETGKVIYSDRPIPGATSSEEVAIEPGPGEAQVKEAQERADRTSQRATEMAEERARKQQATRVSEGQREPAEVEPVQESGRAGWYPGYSWPRPPLGGGRPPGPPARPPLRPKPPPKPVQLPIR